MKHDTVRDGIVKRCLQKRVVIIKTTIILNKRKHVCHVPGLKKHSRFLYTRIILQDVICRHTLEIVPSPACLLQLSDIQQGRDLTLSLYKL